MGRRKVFKIRNYEPLVEQRGLLCGVFGRTMTAIVAAVAPTGGGLCPRSAGEGGAGNGRSLAATPSVEAACCHGCHLRDPPWATAVGGNSRWEPSPGERPVGERRPRGGRGRGCWRGHGKTGSNRLALEKLAAAQRGCHRAGSPGGACGRAGAAPPLRVCAGQAAPAAPLREQIGRAHV